MKTLHLIFPVLMVISGCALEEGTAQQRLNGFGQYFGERVGHDAFTKAATAVSFSPFAYLDDTSATSQSKVSIGYQEIATVIGPTNLSGGTIVTVKAARFGARLHTAHVNGVTNVPTSDAIQFFSGNGNGTLSTSTPPTGCTTTIGGTTFAGFVADDMDPATETYRVANGLTNQGIYGWCPNTTVVWRDSTGLHAHLLNSSGTIVNVSLTGKCLTGDSANTCIGKLTTTGKIALASVKAKNANTDLPSLGMQPDSEANVTSGAYVFSADLNFVKDTSLSDMNPIWNRVRDGGPGQAAALTDLIASGASAP